MHAVTEKSQPKPEAAKHRKTYVKLSNRECNLCGHKFRPHSKYERFCETCREHSEAFHYGDWMISA